MIRPIVVSIAVMMGTVLPLAAQVEAGSNEGVHAEPSPREWAAPAYPPEAIKAGVEGVVKIKFVVDAEGKIVDLALNDSPESETTVDVRLSAAALAAAKQWTFSPALNNGTPEPRAVMTQVRFLLKGRGGKPSVSVPLNEYQMLSLENQPLRSARARNLPDPPYPDEVLSRKLPGSAEFRFFVGKTGEVEHAVVTYASDAVFVTPGLATLQRWKFEPALQGSIPVVTEKVAPMDFEVVGDDVSPAAILKANGISGLDSNAMDVPPVPRSLPMPVYPRARLVAGTGGVADVEFTIDEQGLTKNISVMSATEPEFGESLAAAVAAWVFKPAFFERSRTSVNLRVKHEFVLKETDPTAPLVEAIKAGTVSGAGGLDRRLTPLWRVAPVYPYHLLEQKVTGSATIEFIIDREGRARFPLVKEATHDVFGWSAATAISQWVFAPPMRKGVPVAVKVNIPLEFTPPET